MACFEKGLSKGLSKHQNLTVKYERRGTPRRSFLFAICFFQCVSDSLTRPPDAFLIGVGIHSERYRSVTVAQPLRYADHIRAVGNREACGGMAEFVGVKVFDAVTLPEFLEKAGGRLWVHRLKGIFLSKDISADCPCTLIVSEITQH